MSFHVAIKTDLFCPTNWNKIFFYKERINDTIQQQSKVDISTVHALLLQKDKHSIVIVV